MNKVELIAAVADKTGITKKDAENIITAFTDIVTEALANGEKVSLVGFGTFETKTRASREGINPRTKEKITIPASKTPGFKAGKVLKESVK
jgi:DNA-binding protein HU-beta